MQWFSGKSSMATLKYQSQVLNLGVHIVLPHPTIMLCENFEAIKTRKNILSDI